MAKLLQRLRKWWLKRRLRKHNPALASRLDLLNTAIKQGNRNPVSRAKRGRGND